jgi:predicted AlkP superfamily phosphohydrolase/phosphomutase
LDGADFTLVHRFVDRGLLPHFETLIRNGSFGKLKTYTPTLSPLIWTTLVTGHAPSSHGVEYFLVENNRGVIGSVSSGQRRVPALWNILSASGFTVGVNNWWATWPAETVNGYVISDYGIRSTQNRPAYPECLTAELRPEMEVLGRTSFEAMRRFVDMPDSMGKGFRVPAEFVPEDLFSRLDFCRMIDRTVENFYTYMARRIPVDVEFVYFTGLDAVQHWFWEFMEPDKFRSVRETGQSDFAKVIERYYIYVDTLLGKFMDRVKTGGTLFVMSDHGFEANPDYVPGPGQVSGHHEGAPDGIFGAIGQGIARNSSPKLSVYDVTPTILTHLGLPVGEDMTGLCRTELFDHSPEITTIPTYTLPPYFVPSSPEEVEAADKTVLARLEALGYIE